jgi:hypothetical protein
MLNTQRESAINWLGKLAYGSSSPLWDSNGVITTRLIDSVVIT